jgi:hypothetical protein
LNVESVVDVSSPFALFVCSNVIKDVAADAIMNKVADHTNFTKNIATVVEEIVHEDRNKTLESDVIADITEDAVDKAVRQSGVENDDGYAAGEEIVATTDGRAYIVYHYPYIKPNHQLKYLTQNLNCGCDPIEHDFPHRIQHYYKTRLLQLGFSTSTSEKTRILLTWKTTSRFRQAIKCGYSHVGQDVPNGHVPNGSEV